MVSTPAQKAGDVGSIPVSIPIPCVHIYLNICTYPYVHTHRYAHIIHRLKYLDVCMLTYLCKHTYVHVCKKHMYINVCTYTYINKGTYVHI